MYKGNEDISDIRRYLKIFLIMLSFVKCVHFITFYEEFGFFIKMMILTLYDLVPFIISYIVFGLFFALIYYVLGTEIDPELYSGVGLGRFGLLFLTVWRNSVGKLGFAQYHDLIDNPANFGTMLDIQLFLIWGSYFT